MFIREDNLFPAALIFEQANGNRLDQNDRLLIEKSGLSHCFAERIEAALIDALNDGPPLSYRSTAYWALSKRFNRKLIPAFKSWMNRELQEQDGGALYQLLIALDNLGEPVFADDRMGSYSATDTGLNIRDAKDYLDNHP